MARIAAKLAVSQGTVSQVAHYPDAWRQTPSYRKIAPELAKAGVPGFGNGKR